MFVLLDRAHLLFFLCLFILASFGLLGLESPLLVPGFWTLVGGRSLKSSHCKGGAKSGLQIFLGVGTSVPASENIIFSLAGFLPFLYCIFPRLYLIPVRTVIRVSIEPFLATLVGQEDRLQFMGESCL